MPLPDTAAPCCPSSQVSLVSPTQVQKPVTPHSFPCPTLLPEPIPLWIFLIPLPPTATNTASTTGMRVCACWALTSGPPSLFYSPAGWLTHIFPNVFSVEPGWLPTLQQLLSTLTEQAQVTVAVIRSMHGFGIITWTVCLFNFEGAVGARFLLIIPPSRA